jgi:hypothetical protein
MDKYDKPASLDAAAAAAIRVCLAEAQRAVEALTYEPVPTPVLIYRDDVLAVLAALAEEQA